MESLSTASLNPADDRWVGVAAASEAPVSSLVQRDEEQFGVCLKRCQGLSNRLYSGRE
jgi:hypothetical protein